MSTAALSLSADDFTLLGLPRRFALQRAALDARWKDLLREAHPDKFAVQGAAAQRVALQWSVRINEAYQRLKDPVRRAAYLCELGGVAIDAERNTAMPTDFLMQQMQWREALDEAGGVTELEQLHDTVTQARRDALQVCEQAIDEQSQLDVAAQQVRRLMFIERFLQDIGQRLDQMPAA